jgi:cell wall-associated NlpC family hydrolase
MKSTYIFAIIFLFSGCMLDYHRSFGQPGSTGSGSSESGSVQQSVPDRAETTTPPRRGNTGTRHIGFTIQAGAFAESANAVRFAESLQTQGLDAYYFKAEDGLYRVRFGDYRGRDGALSRANALKEKGILESFYIVSPDEHPVADTTPGSTNRTRESIVASAKRFIGTPYQWGGSSSSGVDCSGLAMAVYRLHGLELPRVAAAQYSSGTSISKSQLQKGDLVFFATMGGREISHVGIYAGSGEFVHAPGRGKQVVQVKMDNSYWQRTYVGSAKYL